MTKMIYRFGPDRAEGRADQRDLLGGKGANLAEMANLGIPVPPGFTITTELCARYFEARREFPAGLEQGVRELLDPLVGLGPAHLSPLVAVAHHRSAQPIGIVVEAAERGALRA